MPRKTLYVTEAAEITYDAADTYARFIGRSLSGVVATLLHTWLEKERVSNPKDFSTALRLAKAEAAAHARRRTRLRKKAKA